MRFTATPLLLFIPVVVLLLLNAFAVAEGIEFRPAEPEHGFESPHQDSDDSDRGDGGGGGNTTFSGDTGHLAREPPEIDNWSK
jgi:hypothetical protein